MVALYLIAQMVGAGKLIQLLFGLNYHIAVVLVGILMVLYVLFGGMLATTWVQIIKVVLLLAGASFMALMVMKTVGFSFNRLFADAMAVHGKGAAIMRPGGLVADPISALSLGLALMFGTAGLPHILMRFFTVSDAREARKSVFYATGFMGYFYFLTFIIGFGAILLVGANPAFKDSAGALLGGWLGLITAVVLMIIGPTIWVQVWGMPNRFILMNTQHCSRCWWRLSAPGCFPLPIIRRRVPGSASCLCRNLYVPRPVSAFPPARTISRSLRHAQLGSRQPRRGLDMELGSVYAFWRRSVRVTFVEGAGRAGDGSPGFASGPGQRVMGNPGLYRGRDGA